MRTNPQAYAKRLEAVKASYRGKLRILADGTRLETQEGVRAVDEAIRALRSQRPLGALELSTCLGASAAEHVRDLGPKGLMSHSGSKGESFEHRLLRYAPNASAFAENIAFGPASASEVVMDLLIDDGVPGRGHRHNLLDPSFQEMGVACGPHATFRSMCVMDFASGAPTRR